MAAHKEEHAKLQYRDRSDRMATLKVAVPRTKRAHGYSRATLNNSRGFCITPHYMLRSGNLRACSIPSSLPIADWNL